jgi:hypothetical protein
MVYITLLLLTGHVDGAEDVVLWRPPHRVAVGGRQRDPLYYH